MEDGHVKGLKRKHGGEDCADILEECDLIDMTIIKINHYRNNLNARSNCLRFVLARNTLQKAKYKLSLELVEDRNSNQHQSILNKMNYSQNSCQGTRDASHHEDNFNIMHHLRVYDTASIGMCPHTILSDHTNKQTIGIETKVPGVNDGEQALNIVSPPAISLPFNSSSENAIQIHRLQICEKENSRNNTLDQGSVTTFQRPSYHDYLCRGVSDGEFEKTLINTDTQDPFIPLDPPTSLSAMNIKCSSFNRHNSQKDHLDYMLQYLIEGKQH